MILTKNCKINYDDIIGKKFDQVTVLSFNKKVGRHYYYNCQCDCKKFFVVIRDNLLSGRTKSCGHERCINRNEIIGCKIGKYLIKDFDHKDNNSNLYYKCIRLTDNQEVIMRRDSILRSLEIIE